MSTWFFRPGAAIAGLLLQLVGGARVEGSQNVPRAGAYIMVANHNSLADPPILGWTVGFKLGRVVYFMAKDEMRRWPIIGWLADRAGVFFVRRGEGDRAAQRLALQLLADGKPIAVFPEGTRSRDGHLTPMRGGATLLAMRSGALLVPVGISGSHRIFPGGTRFPHRANVSVRIGQPFHLPHVPTGRLDRQALADGTERIMAEVEALLPECHRRRQ